MSQIEDQFKPLPLRAHLARRFIQSFPFRRAKDRIYLILRRALFVPRNVIAEISTGIHLGLDLDDYLQRWMFCHKLEDEPDYYLLSKILRPGEHFVDVGANIGIVSLLAAKAVGPEGTVYAIEALQKTREYLSRNVARNNAENIRLIPFALTDENREVNFFASTDGNIGASSLSPRGLKDVPVTVNGRTFDSLHADGTIPKCDVMKMDIEGAEVLALKGMKVFFKEEKPRIVVIEVSDVLLSQFGSKPSDIVLFFNDHGYSLYRASTKGRLQKVNTAELSGFENLWAVLPGSVEERFMEN